MSWMDVSEVRVLPPGKYFFQLLTGGVKLTVLNSNPLYPGKFIVNCYAICLYQKELKATEPEAAKAEAIQVVKSILVGYIKELEKHE